MLFGTTVLGIIHTEVRAHILSVVGVVCKATRGRRLHRNRTQLGQQGRFVVVVHTTGTIRDSIWSLVLGLSHFSRSATGKQTVKEVLILFWIYFVLLVSIVFSLLL